ncbi:MAG: Asp-tRNA(Asn)/Glu-tRNA(Gln) amidotransferase subunit GatB [Candidatus Alcyoniella australis]|nr:Asp-tRNA(Asn)/Glu-tRNA(Gln) amidotransferase subunit GatB [Candidatus Alcyoniella australis]
MKYETVIGLEVHAQLRTRSKIFCGCSTQFGATPNTNVCPVCLGMPGSLPMLNQAVVGMALKVALATNCSIAQRSVFARKNYFYPDLPKGYQISQYELPLARDGALNVIGEHGESARIGINRIHLEEDAGKNVHPPHDLSHSLVDLNRTGVPLIEIVSEPQISSPEQAANYMREMRRLLRYLGVCDGNMEQGSLRCDANVSLRPVGQVQLGKRSEIKNLNSFRNVQRALQFEVERQAALLDAGGTVEVETRLFDVERGITLPMRSKEEAHDYRYFPDPDLPPLLVDQPWIERMRNELPQLPWERQERFCKRLGLSADDAALLCAEKATADYFEAVTACGVDPKSAANWVMSEVLREVTTPEELPQLKLTPQALAELIRMIGDGTISGKIAKQVFKQVVDQGGSPAQLVEQGGLGVISDEAQLERLADQVLEANPGQVAQYRAGKDKLIGFFIGQAMAASKGKADPATLRRIIQDKLRG